MSSVGDRYDHVEAGSFFNGLKQKKCVSQKISLFADIDCKLAFFSE
jgi:hypothetical protein